MTSGREISSKAAEGEFSSRFFHKHFYRMKAAKGLAPHARFGGLLYACDLIAIN
jgi:hypothetical protein